MKRRSGILLLAIHCLWVAIVWTLVLPRVAGIASVREHIRQMQSSDIPVDAMFYTELAWHPSR